MNLRRSLALAAATAAITPAVLLAAPAAYATEEPAPTASETAPTDEQSTPAPVESSPAEDEPAPGAGESTPGASTPAPPGASTPATETASPSVSASTSAPPGPAQCEDDGAKVDDNLHTSLSGLPSKIVAGSGFHGFKLNVRNSGSQTYQRVDLGVFAAQVDKDDFFVDTSHLTLQFKDPATGKWTDISLDENDEGAGYIGYADVKPKESFSIDLRLAVDKKAPAGLGFAISIGMYADDEGNCVYSGDESYYEFDILKAGSAPGEPGDAKPQGGSKPLPKPVGDNEIDPQGNLAHTGASSLLPVIALTGGAAVAVGAGAVFVVRRRNAADSGTAA